MKKTVHVLTLLLLLFSFQSITAQVTNLSNNTNIRYGYALGSIGIMVDKSGSLWRTDGTTAGTYIFTTKALLDTGTSPVIFNNKIYFSGITAATGKEVWVTDGTDAGTQMVKDIYSGKKGSNPKDFIVFNSAVYFFAATATDGAELWKTNGTATGTTEIKDINPGADGSYNRTYTSLFANNNILYFDAYDGSHGIELWRTDGTLAGTVLIKDIDAGTDSSKAQNFIALGNYVIFSAKDAAHGTEVWRTDGTTAGTILLKDIVSGIAGSSPSQFITFNNKIFFVCQIPGGFIPIPTFNIYSTDGNAVTLVKAFSIGSVPVIQLYALIKNKLFFSASTPDAGLELWSSDGTSSGTQLFDDINPGPTSADAIFLQDYAPVIMGGNPQPALFKGNGVFVADDGTNGAELWMTDGTLAGTHMVKDIFPGIGSSINTDTTQANGLSYYYTADTFYITATNGTTGTELYRTDGTTANTSIVKDLNPGAGNSRPFIFMTVNNHLYFTADNGDNTTGDRDLYILNTDVVLATGGLHLTASLHDNAVNVNWSVLSETNTKNYIIQRSNNGKQFSNVGSIMATGSSNQKSAYAFTDYNATSAGSHILYYRLLITDNDGKTSYSSIASVSLTGNGNFVALYPNPVKDQLSVVINKNISSVSIKITDEKGQPVYTSQLQNIQAGAKNKINVSGFGKGVYYLEFISTDGKQTTKFIKY